MLLLRSRLQIRCWNLVGVKSRLTMEWCAVILVRMDLSESERTSFSGLFFSRSLCFLLRISRQRSISCWLSR